MEGQIRKKNRNRQNAKKSSCVHEYKETNMMTKIREKSPEELQQKWV